MRIAIVHVVFIAEMVYPIQSHQLLQSMRPYGGDHPLPLCELLREADQAAIPADLESDPPEKDCHQLARELPYDFFEDFGIFLCVFFKGFPSHFSREITPLLGCPVKSHPCFCLEVHNTPTLGGLDCSLSKCVISSGSPGRSFLKPDGTPPYISSRFCKPPRGCHSSTPPPCGHCGCSFGALYPFFWPGTPPPPSSTPGGAAVLTLLASPFS